MMCENNVIELKSFRPETRWEEELRREAICTVLVAVDDPGLVERLREVVRGVHEEVFRGLAFQMQRLCGELCNKAAQDGHIQIGDLAALQNALVKRQIEVPARPV